ncbi:MAG: DUF1579 domain-containing protein [Betaproteobacteria bacterium]|jgi:hypothetical protein|nr:DUF1579 domain-containing protein [Betaproteobacteria bacterium]MDH5286335.1 DUF1579 domain-containing protein [Betaproteobacteria bacterium]
MLRHALRLAVAALLAQSAAAFAQPDPAQAEALLGAQRAAMTRLAAMDGAWRGTATFLLPGGLRRSVTQTERIGPLLGGTVKVIEGRGYDDAGGVTFNALGVVSFDSATSRYTLRSYAHGRAGDFAFEPTADGYRWQAPAPGATIRYEATIRDGVLHEVGDRVVEGAPPQRFFEMTLRRVGDSSWPAGDPVPPK